MTPKQLTTVLRTEISEHLNDSQMRATTGADHVRFEWRRKDEKSLAYIMSVNRGFTYHVSLSLTYFHNQVEVLHCLALGLSRQSYRLRGTLLGMGPAELCHVPATSSQQAKLFSHQVVHYLKGEGQEWVMASRGLDQLNHLFNATPALPLTGQSYLLSRAEKGIIIAKLCSDPALPELIAQYRAQLAAADIILTFDDVCQFLAAHSPAALAGFTERDLPPAG